MGASKEGTISVRDKINQVLREASLEDEEDDHHDHNHEPPDRLGEGVGVPISMPVSPNKQGQQQGSTSSPSSSSSNASTTTTPLSFITPSVSIKKEVVTTSNSISLPSSSSGVGVGVVLRDHPYSGPGPIEVKIDTDTEGSNSEELSQNQDGEIVDDVNVRPGRRKSNSLGDVGGGGGGEDESIVLQRRLNENLIRDHLDLIKCISERLISSELQRETAEKEKKQVQVTLDSEKKERLTLLDKFVSSEEQRAQFEARIQGQAETIQGQHETIKSHQATIIANQQVISKQKERIQELEAKLIALTAPKDVSTRETCMTPPPPPPPPTVVVPLSQSQMLPPDSNSSCVTVTVSSNTPGEDEEGEEDGPARKRMKMTPCGTGVRRSDSPPRLSPAVTPKTSAFNSISCLPSASSSSKALRAFFGAEADEEMGPDEFHEELELINNLTRPDTGSETYRSKAHQSKDGVNSDQSLSESTTPSSNFSAFAPPFPKTRPTRFIHPHHHHLPLERRHNFMRTRFPNPSTSTWPSTPGSSSSMNVPKNSSSSSFNRISLNSTTALSSSSSKEPPQLSGLRNNNFLNLSRPVPRRPLMGVTPPPSGDYHRSLDSTSTSSSSPLHSSDAITSQVQDQSPLLTSTPVSSPKKRPPGRPPGSLSRYKSRLPASASPSIASSTTPTTTTPITPSPSSSTSLLQNGTPPEGPQRFSQRGRLLKPNRARWSPTLEASVNQKEKLMTTKKHYFVTEPFATDQLLGQDMTTTGDGTTAKGMEDTGQSKKEKKDGVDAKTKEGTDNGEPEEVVEVPKWRISIVEGFKEGESHKPVVDDMSDEAYLKRHQKLEVKEKQRKRWDSQRLREETYLDRLKRKQEERERQKELRRQQRKRKGKTDATEEEESVLPSVEDIKAIHVSEELPVGAFGHSLPIVEKVAFRLMWIPQPEIIVSSQESPLISPTPPPVLDDNDKSMSVDKVEQVDCEIRDSSLDDDEVEILSSASSSSSRSRSPSPSSSFENVGRTPPPPKIYRMNYLDDEDENSLSGSSNEEDNIINSDDEETDVEMNSADELSNSDDDNINSTIPLPVPSSSPPPSTTTIDLFYPEGECSSSPDHDHDHDHPDQDHKLLKLDAENEYAIDIDQVHDHDDEQVCSSSISSSPPPHLPSTTHPVSLPSVVVSRLEKVNLIRCPIGSPTSSCTPSSSTETSSTRSQAAAAAAAASITFFIPKNPLSSSKKSRGDVSSSTNTSSSSPTSSTEAEQFCKDRNIRS